MVSSIERDMYRIYVALNYNHLNYNAANLSLSNK